ncbi:hypothetical protein SLA2020_394440 [Shorea laevis]
MATYKQPLLSLLLLALTINFAAAARVLDEEEPLVPTTAPGEPDSVVTPITGTTPAAGAAATGAVGTEDLPSSLANVIQSNGNNQINGLGVPVLSGGQLPAGSTIEKFMFGTLTVIDDELTEGHELGSGLVGKAQGFCVASSVDGTSQTLAFTAMFESGGVNQHETDGVGTLLQFTLYLAY